MQHTSSTHPLSASGQVPYLRRSERGAVHHRERSLAPSSPLLLAVCSSLSRTKRRGTPEPLGGKKVGTHPHSRRNTWYNETGTAIPVQSSLSLYVCVFSVLPLSLPVTINPTSLQPEHCQRCFPDRDRYRYFAWPHSLSSSFWGRISVPKDLHSIRRVASEFLIAVSGIIDNGDIDPTYFYLFLLLKEPIVGFLRARRK